MDYNSDLLETEPNRNLTELRAILKDDRVVLEAKWVLFCSAARSYKKNFLLKPFPPFATRGDYKDFEMIDECIGAMPSLSAKSTGVMTRDQVELLLWVYNNSAYQLVHTDVDKLLGSLRARGLDTAVLGKEANIAFEVQQRTTAAWQQLAEGKKILCGFHGSRLSHFYSILNHGLLSNLNKTAAFGEGTYLSEDLKVSLNWSPSSKPGNARVALGDRVSCVAVCEVVQDTGVSHSQSDRAGVPEKYMVVQNDALINIKYLLLFTETNKQRHQPIISSVRRWMNGNRFLMGMVAYFLILILVGVANSKNFNFYWRKFSGYFSQRQPWSAFEDPS